MNIICYKNENKGQSEIEKICDLFNMQQPKFQCDNFEEKIKEFNSN